MTDHHEFSAQEYEQRMLVVPDDLGKTIDAFHAAIADQIEAWLASLEGTRFETKEEALAAIRKIASIVRQCGRQLLLDRKPVTLTIVSGTRQRRPNIQVSGREEGKRKVILNTVMLPKFTTKIASHRNDIDE